MLDISQFANKSLPELQKIMKDEEEKFDVLAPKLDPRQRAILLNVIAEAKAGNGVPSVQDIKNKLNIK